MMYNLKNSANRIFLGSREKIGDISIYKNGDILEITGWTRYLNLELLTKGAAKNELNEVKKIFNNIKEECLEFCQIANTNNVKFILDYDDGKGSAKICEEINGDITWMSTLME